MDQKQPLISVVIPTFNRAEFIKDAIQSVLNQTIKDFEIFVVDDGSSDHTEDVIKTFEDPRVYYHRFKHMGFPAYPRNRGIELSKGKYIAFLDSDDTWLPAHLEHCQKAFCDNIGAGGVFTDFYKLYNNTLISQRATKTKYNSSTLIDMVSKFSSIGAASNVMVRRDVFNTVGYFDENKDMAGSEDWHMWVRIAWKYAFAVVPAATVILRVHGDNLTLNAENIERSTKTALDSIFCHDGISPIVKPFYRSAYAEVNTLAAINYYGSGDMKTARNRLKDALRFRPRHIFNGRFIWTFLRTLAGKRISYNARRFKRYIRSRGRP